MQPLLLAMQHSDSAFIISVYIIAILVVPVVVYMVYHHHLLNKFRSTSHTIEFDLQDKLGPLARVIKVFKVSTCNHDRYIYYYGK